MCPAVRDCDASPNIHAAFNWAAIFILKKEQNTMKKLFISQPMRGKTDDQILKERKTAVTTAESIVGEPVKIIDSFVTETGTPLEYLSKSIGFLAQADIAYFASGWKDARGCKIEHECAVEYGIDRID